MQRRLPYSPAHTVFTTQQFGDNPFAVFPEADGLSAEDMQTVANELTLSETTFIQNSRNEGSNCTRMRRNMFPQAAHETSDSTDGKRILGEVVGERDR